MTTPDQHTPSSAPFRTCIGCRQRQPQARLVRCVAGAQGPVVSRTADGRGAWLCSLACVDHAVARRAFDRAWKRSITGAELTALRNAFEAVMTNMKDSSTAGNSPELSMSTKG